MIMKKVILLMAALLFMTVQSQAAIKLPSLISDNMVVQRGEMLNLWGDADPGEKITVQPDWHKNPTAFDAGKDGKWQTLITPPPMGKPGSITFTATNTITVAGILTGEVWVCSGQSNMYRPIYWAEKDWGVLDYEKEMAAADFPNIRVFTVKRSVFDTPQTDCGGQWLVSSPQTAANFSGTAYFFGRSLHKQLNVPIGLISSSRGGSKIETWMQPGWVDSVNPSVKFGECFNGMIAPLVPYRIKGFIWYQGESNRDYAEQYRKLFPIMITNWRKLWNQGDLPFYYVQIAPFKAPTKDCVPQLRDAQTAALELPNTGMAVTMDIGDLDDIHPRNKQDVGKRLALWALAKTYGVKDMTYSGPLYKSMKIEGDKIRLFFDHADSGLKHSGQELTGFTIAGVDQDFVEAKAVIDGDTVIVSSGEVLDPAALRYGWNNAAIGSLFNKADLPTPSFRTDNRPFPSLKK